MSRSACGRLFPPGFFEDKPQSSIAEGLQALSGKFLAVRPNQAYYENLTITKAFQKCGQGAQAAAQPAAVVAVRLKDAAPQASTASSSSEGVLVLSQSAGCGHSSKKTDVPAASKSDAAGGDRPVSFAEVKQMINEAMRKNAPEREPATRPCQVAQPKRRTQALRQASGH